MPKYGKGTNRKHSIDLPDTSVNAPDTPVNIALGAFVNASREQDRRRGTGSKATPMPGHKPLKNQGSRATTPKTNKASGSKTPSKVSQKPSPKRNRKMSGRGGNSPARKRYI